MTKKLGTVLMLVLGFAFAAHAKSPEPSRRWTETAANASYAKQPWRVGSNYIPATATGWSEPVPGRDLHPLRTSAFHGAPQTCANAMLRQRYLTLFACSQH